MFVWFFTLVAILWTMSDYSPGLGELFVLGSSCSILEIHLSPFFLGKCLLGPHCLLPSISTISMC